MENDSIELTNIIGSISERYSDLYPQDFIKFIYNVVDELIEEPYDMYADSTGVFSIEYMVNRDIMKIMLSFGKETSIVYNYYNENQDFKIIYKDEDHNANLNTEIESFLMER